MKTMHPMQRRNFLKGAMTAAPLLYASGGWAGANDRLRMAIIGMGGRGRDHMLALARIPNVEVAAFCDPDEDRMAQRAAEFTTQTGRAPKLESDLRRILDDKSIDAITIAAPNHWHALATIWGCQAGKHVYVEKPVAHDATEGQAMVAAARKHNRIVQGGTQRRSLEKIRRAMQGLHDGLIGDIYMARCIHFQRRDSIGFKEVEPPPATLHWDLWLGPGPKRPFHRNLAPYNWHWFWDFGNGELGNNGVHYLDLARWGMKKGLPERIHATGGRFGYRDQGQTPNTLAATYRFPDGKEIVCEIRGRFTNPETGMNSGVIFYGSEGYMSLDSSPGAKVEVYLGAAKEPATGLLKLDDLDPNENWDTRHFQNFCDAVRSGKRETLACEIEEARLSTTLCLLGNISYLTGRELRFDAATERFTGDSEANRMLSREHRAPFVPA